MSSKSVTKTPGQARSARGRSTRKRTTVTTPDPAVVWAEGLWEKLRTGLLDIEATIAQIIHDKAWEPLGYNDFTSAWKAKLGDITLAVELRAHVVYQMFREGATPEDVAAAVKGVGLDSADAYRRQMDNGVPANLATSAKPRKRSDGLQVRTVFIPVPIEQYRKWSGIAAKHDTTLAKIALEALSDAMQEMS